MYIFLFAPTDDPLYGIGGHPKFVEPESTGTDSSFASDG